MRVDHARPDYRTHGFGFSAFTPAGEKIKLVSMPGQFEPVQAAQSRTAAAWIKNQVETDESVDAEDQVKPGQAEAEEPEQDDVRRELRAWDEAVFGPASETVRSKAVPIPQGPVRANARLSDKERDDRVIAFMRQFADASIAQMIATNQTGPKLRAAYQDARNRPKLLDKFEDDLRKSMTDSRLPMHRQFKSAAVRERMLDDMDKNGDGRFDAQVYDLDRGQKSLILEFAIAFEVGRP